MPHESDYDPTLLREIIEQTGEVAYRYRLHPTQGYEFITDSVAGLLGYTPEELYADPELPGKIVHPDDAALMSRVLDAPHGEELAVELRWLRKDGTFVETEIRCVVVRDCTGRAVMVDGVAREISWRDEVHEQRLELLRSRGRLPEQGGETRRARVLIADDHDVTRAGLRAVLVRDPGFEVVAEARDGAEALSLVAALRPDLVLMDIRMPGMDGLEATRRVKEAMPMTCVLVLSMFDDVELLVESVKAGAAGYVLKASSEAVLRSAIWEALRGEWPLDRHLAREVLQRLASEQSRRPAVLPVADPLSPREREVLRLLARGRTNREIGEALAVTPHTVKIHVEHILAKLGVSDRTQAAVRSIELGYITPDSSK